MRDPHPRHAAAHETPPPQRARTGAASTGRAAGPAANLIQSRTARRRRRPTPARRRTTSLVGSDSAGSARVLGGHGCRVAHARPAPSTQKPAPWRASAESLERAPPLLFLPCPPSSLSRSLSIPLSLHPARSLSRSLSRWRRSRTAGRRPRPRRAAPPSSPPSSCRHSKNALRYGFTARKAGMERIRARGRGDSTRRIGDGTRTPAEQRRRARKSTREHGRAWKSMEERGGAQKSVNAEERERGRAGLSGV